MFNLNDDCLGRITSFLENTPICEHEISALYCMDCSNQCAENCAYNCHKKNDKK